MPLYEVTAELLKRIEETSFYEARIRERADLQRLLRSQIEIVIPDALVIAEEFGEWEESRRRIDLLAIDKDANLVVIELKRTEDGGHMELQALRYAAMISTMTFDNAVTVYGEYLKRSGRELDPQQELLDFLEWDEKNEEHFAQDVRIILVSAEFSKELTGSVLWLNSYGLDIRCVRIKPYQDNGRILIDVQQVIPLPEATEYQVQVNVKNRQERAARASGRAWVKYDVTIQGATETITAKRNAIFRVVRHLCEKGVKPESIGELIYWKTNRLFAIADGTLSSQEFVSAASKSNRAQGKHFYAGKWFCDEGELIYYESKTYAFTNQWGERWDQAMKILIEAFPEEKISYKVSDTS
jgi:hypothetical protein